MRQPRIVDTRVITNFLTDAEVDIILKEYAETKAICEDTPFYRDGILQNHTCGIRYQNEQGEDIARETFKKTNIILETKLKKEFGDDLNIGTIHILKSYQPYKCHTDALDGQAKMDDYHYGAYTFVIPLETCDSYTIVFNEWYEKGKLLDEWLADYPELKPKDTISEEIYQKHLSAEHKEYMRYLSIDTIFPWTKGGCLAMSRYKFHGSDNFPTVMKSKLGIIVWTVDNYGPKS